MKKTYIKPVSERISIACEKMILTSGGKLNDHASNVINDQNSQSSSTEDQAGKGAGTLAPSTRGDWEVGPGDEVGARVNPWGSWE